MSAGGRLTSLRLPAAKIMKPMKRIRKARTVVHLDKCPFRTPDCNPFHPRRQLLVNAAIAASRVAS
jgi:hypothetical protein